jgi:predicted nucleic acid-binding Zn ribbon protein
VSRRKDSEQQRNSLPRPLGEILDPALQSLITSDQARAFSAWARASGAPVSSCARPSRFFNGLLTVECASSIWANELTYLSGEILARMNDVAPGHPVRRLRFVVERVVRSTEDPERLETPPDEPIERLSGEALESARARAAEVRDPRLREAIEAALRTSSGDT